MSDKKEIERKDLPSYIIDLVDAVGMYRQRHHMVQSGVAESVELFGLLAEVRIAHRNLPDSVRLEKDKGKHNVNI